MPHKGYQNISLKIETLVLLDEMPGKNRPEKIERLIKSASDRLSGQESPEAIAAHILKAWTREQKIELIVELVRSLS